MKKYDIDAVKDEVKSIEKLSGKKYICSESGDEELRKVLYEINQISHRIIHNIENYRLH